MLRIAAFTILATSLTSCASVYVMSHVPTATMAKLSAMTVADIDPKELRVVARLARGLEPQPNGVKVTLGLSAPQGGRRAETFALEALQTSSEMAAVARFQRLDEGLFVYQLSAADMARLSRIIDETAQASGRKSISISAGVDACHRGPLAEGALPSTTILRANTSGYFVLAEDLDIRRLVPASELAAKVPACAS